MFILMNRFEFEQKIINTYIQMFFFALFVLIKKKLNFLLLIRIK